MADSNLPGELKAKHPDRPTLLYDDGCRFCRAMAELLYRLARRRDLAFLPWSSAIAEAWLSGLTPKVRDRSMHLKRSDGTLISGGSAFAATLANVRGLKWIAGLAEDVPMAGALLARQYDFFAGHREFLSRCVPDRPPVVREPRLK